MTIDDYKNLHQNFVKKIEKEDNDDLLQWNSINWKVSTK
jgi:hypothetical protein